MRACSRAHTCVHAYVCVCVRARVHACMCVSLPKPRLAQQRNAQARPCSLSSHERPSDPLISVARGHQTSHGWTESKALLVQFSVGKI